MALRYPSLVERILANSVISTEHYMLVAGEISFCWEWLGKRSRSNRQNGGYPVLTVRSKVRGRGKRKLPRNVRVTRIVGEIFCGKPPMKKHHTARHQCFNINCVHPHHVLHGTQRQNVLDTVRAGRHGNRYRKGVNHNEHRLAA